MGHMHFPRYIHRDARDFFYLTARTVLPGTPITGGGAAEAAADGEGGTFRVKGLPQHGYPYAVAITSVRLGADASDKRVRVLRVDPRTVRAEAEAGAGAGAGAEGDGGAGAGAVVAVFARAARTPAGAAATDRHRRGGRDAGDAPAGDGRKLWLGPHVFAIEKTPPRAATALADVVLLAAPGAADARAAVGISDEDGMLQWVELMPDDKPDAATAERMMKLLERLGCSSRGLVVGDVRAFLGGTLDIGGQPAAANAPVARLLRAAAPGARAYFESTEVVPQSVWFPLQQQRVKWRPTLAPPDKPAASGSAASPAPSPPPK